MKRNKFSKALKQLKTTELDERIKSLEESVPTNSIGGVYALNQPGQRLGPYDPPKVFYPDTDGNWPDGIPGTPGERSYTRPAGHWEYGPGAAPSVDWDNTVDFSHSGTSTDGFIDPTDGTVLSNLPPDSSSFILGPLVDGYTYNHGYDDFTNIGYIQKDTRQFVLLARIQGYWKSGSAGNAGAGRNPAREWGGESDGFTSYNENFTLAMAQWFRDQYNNGIYIKNVSYFYNGGQPQSDNPDPNAPPGSKGGICGGAGSGGGPDEEGPYGSGGDPNIGTPQNPPNGGGPEDAGYPWGPEDFDDKPVPPDLYGDLAILGLSAAAAAALMKAIGIAGIVAAARAARLARAAKNWWNNWWNKGRNERIPDENNAPWRKLLDDDLAQRGQSDASFARGDKPPLFGRPDQAFNPFRPGSKGGPGSGPTPAVRQAFERPIRWLLGQSYEMGGNFISEEVGDDLIDAIEKALLETKTLGQFLGLLDKVIEVLEKRASVKQVKESKEVLTESRKRILREIKQPYKLPEQPKQKYKMNFKGKFRPQNTPDVTASKQTDEGVKAQNAAGQTWRTKDKHWSRYQSQERMNVVYDHIGHGNQYWDMIVNENQNKKGTRDRQIQEYLNIIAHEKAMLQEDPNYISPFKQKIEEQETLQADKDPLFKKVASRLKTKIDYPDKPSKKGYPDTPPPEMVNGFHPEYGNKGDYYNKLDPQSAEAMPPTGNAEIDAKVQKAKRIKKVLGKKG